MVSAQRHIEAMDKIGALVSVRERSVKETRERLVASGFSPEEAEDAVSTAVRVGVIDEQRYTRAYIRGKASMGWGRIKISNRLQANGISEDIIASCSDEFPSSQEEYERALNELAKHGTKSSNPKAALVRRLVGKGYSYDISSRAVREFLAGS